MSARAARARSFTAAALVFGLALASVVAATGPASAQTPQSRPNIIVLMTDDQEPASMKVMKTVRKEMRDKGVEMNNYFTNFPLCCPSRATMLTGQYAHNHGVLSNVEPDGGYGVFNERHGNDYLPLWLQQSGYTTAYMGKYLNEYAEPDEYGTTPSDVPKGWNEWRVLAPSRAQYFSYTLNQNGVLTQYTDAEEDYSTDVFTTKAKRYIRRSAPSANPFFLMLGYAAPHGGGGGEPGRSCNRGAEPAPRHLGDLKQQKKFPLPPSFNEADVSDKPSPIQKLAPLTPGQISDITRKRRCSWESLLAVDESVGTLLAELKRTKELANTYVFYVSDNGFLRGEHRIRNNKRFLYEESARVPFIARGPGIPRGEESENVVTNADLVPTILSLSGAAAGKTQDGESLMPSLTNPQLETGRAILHEAYAGLPILGVRTSRYLYAEWATEASEGVLPPLLTGEPELELYDTYADPYQLTNLAHDPAYAGVVDDLALELDRLLDCAGASCLTRPGALLNVAPAAVGAKNCAVEPVVASVQVPNPADVITVTFRADGVSAGSDTAPPYEALLPYQALRDARPKTATVSAKVLFADGRRLGLTSKILACA